MRRQKVFFSAFLFALCILMSTELATAVTYSDSIHSSTVQRLVDPPYATGNCAHCHMQHASFEGAVLTPSSFALFAATSTAAGSAQTTNVCFECHTNGTITNQSYSSTFGGETPVAGANIESTFSATGSSHDLATVYLKTQEYFSLSAGGDGEVPDGANPCSGCHNPHLVQKNNNTGGSYNPSLAAISLPTARALNLWGDDDGSSDFERMDEYATNNFGEYRAPFYVGANPAQTSTIHEPDGSASRDIYSPVVQGSTTPNYVTFCMACHTYSMGSSNAINYSSDKHGLAAAGIADNQGPRIAPYTVDGNSGSSYDSSVNFVLSCLDCHEPHGSENNFYLLRSTVNGKALSPMTDNFNVYVLCYACHNVGGHKNGQECLSCHSHNGRF